ncbi:HpcH/HpaI aldolase/citrate lyase family protein [Sinorhizobium meliloti]|uniref:HpcH/HpaI aldolase/citrate lyase family protein n=1 Tax=Rhizobium meliloti TaxID=382 RepID=UPI00398D5E98
MTALLDFTTALFVPADRPERFAKAAASRADAVIIDLEDAIGVAHKTAARAHVATDFTDGPVILRINAAGTRWHADDLLAAARLKLSAILLPKAEAGETLDVIARGPAAHLPLIALVETARGIAEAHAIATHPAVQRLAFGSIDFAADLGCAHTREALLSARSALVLASRLAGLPPPIDGVTTAIGDEALVFDDARYGQRLGFGGKFCIHPRQVEAIRHGYAPEALEIAWAERVLASGDGVISIDGTMIDEPVRLRARSVLQRAGLMERSIR